MRLAIVDVRGRQRIKADSALTLHASHAIRNAICVVLRFLQAHELVMLALDAISRMRGDAARRRVKAR